VPLPVTVTGDGASGGGVVTATLGAEQEGVTVSSERVGRCEWCGTEFVAANERGPVPKFCRRSHRQRAYEAAQSSAPPAAPPSTTNTTHALTALRDLLDQPIGAADAKRPTVLAPRLEQLIDAVVAVIRAVGYDPDDLDATRLFVVAADVVEPLLAQRRVLVDHPRSAKKLARALADTERFARALLDPAATAERAKFTHGRLLRVAVPGPDRLLPPGVVEVDFDTSGHREVRWYPSYDSIHDGAQLHRVARRRNDPHRFSDLDDWTNLARDLIIVCAGWITSPLPMPTSLDQRASRELGGQLMRQFRTGPWSITGEEVLSWLTSCGYVTVTGDTAISDPALETVQSQ